MHERRDKWDRERRGKLEAMGHKDHEIQGHGKDPRGLLWLKELPIGQHWLRAWKMV